MPLFNLSLLCPRTYPQWCVSPATVMQNTAASTLPCFSQGTTQPRSGPPHWPEMAPGPAWSNFTSWAQVSGVWVQLRCAHGAAGLARAGLFLASHPSVKAGFISTPCPDSGGRVWRHLRAADCHAHPAHGAHHLPGCLRLLLQQEEVMCRGPELHRDHVQIKPVRMGARLHGVETHRPSLAWALWRAQRA